MLAKRQLFVGNQTDIISDAGQQLPDHQTVGQTMRMVGHHDNGALFRNALQLSRPELVFQIQVFDGQIKEIIGRSFLGKIPGYLIIGNVQPFQTQQLFSGRKHKRRNADVIAKEIFQIHHFLTRSLRHRALFTLLPNKRKPLFIQEDRTLACFFASLIHSVNDNWLMPQRHEKIFPLFHFRA